MAEGVHRHQRRGSARRSRWLKQPSPRTSAISCEVVVELARDPCPSVRGLAVHEMRRRRRSRRRRWRSRRRSARAPGPRRPAARRRAAGTTCSAAVPLTTPPHVSRRCSAASSRSKRSTILADGRDPAGVEALLHVGPFVAGEARARAGRRRRAGATRQTCRIAASAACGCVSVAASDVVDVGLVAREVGRVGEPRDGLARARAGSRPARRTAAPSRAVAAPCVLSAHSRSTSLVSGRRRCSSRLDLDLARPSPRRSAAPCRRCEISKLLPMLMTSPTASSRLGDGDEAAHRVGDEVEVARRVQRAELDLRCARWRSA